MHDDLPGASVTDLKVLERLIDGPSDAYSIVEVEPDPRYGEETYEHVRRLSVLSKHMDRRLSKLERRGLVEALPRSPDEWFGKYRITELGLRVLARDGQPRSISR